MFPKSKAKTATPSPGPARSQMSSPDTGTKSYLKRILGVKKKFPLSEKMDFAVMQMKKYPRLGVTITKKTKKK